MLIIYIGHQCEGGEYVQTPIQLKHLHQENNVWHNVWQNNECT
jgi:hypothetical protein